MSKYDMPIFSSRQVWHFTTYNSSGPGMQERVQSSPIHRMPGYESGPAQIIKAMKDDAGRHHLFVFGSLCWDAYVEGSDKWRKIYTDQTTEFLQLRMSFLQKPQAWKDRAHVLAEYAVKEVRHRNPADMSGSRPDLYTKTFLEERLGIGARHFDRDAGEQWSYLTGELESWIGQALAPLAKWVEQKRAGEE